VKIPDTELGAFDMDGEVDFTATAQILDVTVSAMLGPSYLQVNKMSKTPTDPMANLGWF
jgi:hypothetical protein